MNKLILSLLLVTTTARADITAHFQYAGTILLGGAIATAIKDFEKSKSPKEIKDVKVISVNDTVPFGKICELKSVVINEQIITNQYCY